MKLSAVIFSLLICLPVLANKRCVELVVGENHRLHFQVNEGHGVVNRVAGHALTATAGPFWLNAMSDVIEKAATNEAPISVYDKMLSAFEIQYRVRGMESGSIPKDGPLIIVANHPRFGIDGLAIGSMISKVRTDLKIAMNEMVQIVPGFKDVAFGVEMSGDRNENIRAFQEMRQWLKQGHAVLIFPAGAVSGYQSQTGQIEDRAWSRSIPLLARQTNAAIFPVHVSPYQPGLTFRVLDRMGSAAQKSTYPRENLRQRGTMVDLTVGEVFTAETLSGFVSLEAASQFLRQKTYELGRVTF